MSRTRIVLAAAAATAAASIPAVSFASFAGGSSHRSSASVISVCITVTPKQVAVTAGPEGAHEGASLSRTCVVL